MCSILKLSYFYNDLRVKICGKPCHKADAANVIVLEGVVSKLFPITNSFPALCYSPVVIVCVHLNMYTYG